MDALAAELVRIVMADDWTAEFGAGRLRTRPEATTPALRLLRARVARAMIARPTQFTARADATLGVALREGGSAEAGDEIPWQRGA